jgi:type VI secretion system secreted protein VgrG
MENDSNSTKHAAIRGLSAGEIAMARPIFREAIGYHKVKVHRGGFWGWLDRGDNAMVPFGEMYFPSSAHSDDFSSESDAAKVWFIHEMAHVWQYQLGYPVFFAGIRIALCGGYHLRGRKKAPVYRYDLAGCDAGKTLSELNMEQQAEIIAAYFDATCLEGNSVRRQEHLVQLPFLSHVLAEFLGAPADAALLPQTCGPCYWWTRRGD